MTATCNPLDKLTELAIIATGPQSPLMQQDSEEESAEVRLFCDVTSINSIHSYAKPPRTRSPSPILLKPAKKTTKSKHARKKNSYVDIKMDSNCESLIEHGINSTNDLWTMWDCNAALALSDMARSHSLLRNHDDDDDGVSSSRVDSTCKPAAKRIRHKSAKIDAASSPHVGKRPMNAFMLFAKRSRLEYTRLHPGKDNRAISVILGDKWRNLCNDEKQVFALEARLMADEYKKTNPDCWKRKRSYSTNS